MLALHKRAVLSCIGLNLTYRHHWRVCSCRHDQDFDSESPAVAEVAVGRALVCWIAVGWPTIRGGWRIAVHASADDHKLRCYQRSQQHEPRF